MRSALVKTLAIAPWVAAAALLCAGAAAAAVPQTLYAVTARTYSDPGYTGVEGNIYVVDTGNAALTLVTSLRLHDTSIGLDGLAVNPRSGVFYGITASTSRVIPSSLVSVDLATGEVTLIGRLGHAGSDISFDPDGTLFIWLSDTRQLGTVNLDTGAATPRGIPLSDGAAKGGLALIGGGRALIAATGGAGTLDLVDLVTGKITQGRTLAGAPFPDLINGLAYSPDDGVLYAVNTNFAGASRADLVKIDVRSGKVEKIGPLPNDTEALAFGPALSKGKEMTVMLKDWRLPLLAALLLLLVGFVALMLRSGKR